MNYFLENIHKSWQAKRYRYHRANIEYEWSEFIKHFYVHMFKKIPISFIFITNCFRKALFVLVNREKVYTFIYIFF